VGLTLSSCASERSLDVSFGVDISVTTLFVPTLRLDSVSCNFMLPEFDAEPVIGVRYFVFREYFIVAVDYANLVVLCDDMFSKVHRFLASLSPMKVR